MEGGRQGRRRKGGRGGKNAKTLYNITERPRS